METMEHKTFADVDVNDKLVYLDTMSITFGYARVTSTFIDHSYKRIKCVSDADPCTGCQNTSFNFNTIPDTSHTTCNDRYIIFTEMDELREYVANQCRIWDAMGKLLDNIRQTSDPDEPSDVHPDTETNKTMTIIYSNMGDDDCRMLTGIWQNIPGVNLVEITPDTDGDYEERVNDAIANEDDTLLLIGHGTCYGLLFPDMTRGEYIVHENNFDLIHARNVICCWCHANLFCEAHDIRSFATSMFITNTKEAEHYGKTGFTQERINTATERFAREMNGMLADGTPLERWVLSFLENTDTGNAIDMFNRCGLRYIASQDT